ncbi:MAG: TolC family protein [Thermotogae bacterium]|nr:TolC family protein [Thermotogota bacterium]
MAIILTEDEAVRIGLRNFPNLIADSLEILASHEQVQELGASLWPKVELQLGYSYNSYAPTMVMASPVRWRFQETPPGSGQGIAFPDSFVVDTLEFGRKHNFRVSLGVSRTLWSWGRLESGYFIQKRALEAKWIDYEAKRLRYEYDVRRVYTATLLQREALKVAEESYGAAEENLKLVKEAYRNGRATRIDYLRAQVSLENARYELMSARRGYESSLSTLRTFLGLPDTTEILIGDSLTLPETPPDTTVAWKDVEFLEIQASVLRDVARQEAKAFLPVIFGSLTYNYQRPLGFEDRWGSNWVATLGMSWTLFDGLKPLHSYRRYLYQADALARRAAFLKRKAKTDVMNALREYETALRKVEVARRTLDMARESFSLARQSYAHGRLPYTDLKEVEVSYTKALFNYKRAVADARMLYWKVFYLSRTSLSNGSP